MKVKPFEFLLVFVPEGEDAEQPEIILGPEVVLAKDQKHAEQLAARAIPDSYMTALAGGEVGVFVRPF
jgi:hypothetical protein